jgi:hypothetical protein
MRRSLAVMAVLVALMTGVWWWTATGAGTGARPAVAAPAMRDPPPLPGPPEAGGAVAPAPERNGRAVAPVSPVPIGSIEATTPTPAPSDADAGALATIPVTIHVEDAAGRAVDGAVVELWNDWSRGELVQSGVHFLEGAEATPSHAASSRAPGPEAEWPLGTPHRAARTDRYGLARFGLAKTPWLARARQDPEKSSAFCRLDGHLADREREGQPFVLTLHGPAHVSGSVVDATGRPIPHALVRVERDGLGAPVWASVACADAGPADVVSDQSGRFCMDVRGAFYGRVAAIADEATSEWIDFTKGSDGLTLVVGRRARLVISVSDEAGTPRPDADVRVENVETSYSPVAEVETDASGHVEIEVRPGATYVLRATADARASVCPEPVRVTVDPFDPIVHVALRLVASTSISGRMVDLQGVPLENLHVTAEPTSRWADRLGASSTRPSDELGRWSVTRLVPGVEYDLSVRCGRPPTSITVAERVVAGTQDLLLHVDPNQSTQWLLKGLVVDAGTGAPIGDALVEVFAVSRREGIEVVRENEDNRRPVERPGAGGFTVRRLDRARLYRVFVGAPAYVDIELDVDAAGWEHESLTIRMDRGSALQVRVATTEGRAVGSARVCVFEAKDGYRNVFLEEPLHVGRTDPEGVCVVDRLAPGEYWAQALADGLGLSPVHRFVMPRGPSTVGIAMDETQDEDRATVVVRASDRDAPLADVEVVLVSCFPGAEAIAGRFGETDGSGSVTLEHVACGLYRLYARHPQWGFLAADPTYVLVEDEGPTALQCTTKR